MSTASDAATAGYLVAAIDAMCEARGDVVAFSDGTNTVTYRELKARSDAIARAIVSRDPGSRSPLPMLGANGATCLVAYLSARKADRLAGTIDSRAPEEHVRGCLETLGATEVITDAATADLARALVGDRALVLEELELEPIAAGVELPRIDPDAAASVVFTSGSTGRPKAVVHCERGVCTVQRNWSSAGLYSGDDVFAAISAGCGPAATANLNNLLAGATTYGFDLQHHGLHDLPAWIAAHQVTVAPMTRGLLRTLGDSLPAGTVLEPLRVVRTVGEPLLPGDVEAARRILPTDARLQFEFGMNEAGVLAARAIGDDEAETSTAVTVVGPLLQGVDLRIVGPDGEVVPPGEPGEIIVRGANVALEYRNEPELNALRFRLVDGEREFSTGDLGRMRADGSLEFLGRNDARLKIRNFTIEPAEVEAALVALPEIAEAGVTSAPDAKGSPMLVAYLVPAGDARLRSPAIRAELAARVPSHFVPSVFYAVPAIAKTRTGKIDRAELRRVAAEALIVRPPYEPPADIRERTLQQIVSEILKVDAVGRNDDIFELGADSLDLLELFSALHERFAVDLPESLVLEAPTIALLAERIAAGEAGAGDDDGAVLLSEPAPGLPFFCVTGVGSYAFRLRPLARELCAREARPVYGLKSFGPGRSEVHDVEARAEQLVASMRAVQPHGPYAVGGHSAGGVVAYEMARRLRAEGESVELVALLDTLLPRSFGGRVRVLRDRAQRRWKGSGLHDRLRRAKYVGYHLTVPVVRRHRARRSLEDAGTGHELPARYRMGPFDGHVLYVAAADREAGRIRDDERIEDVDILRKVVSGPISVVIVPGGHASYIDPANAGAVADAVAAAMHGPITPD